MNTAIPAEYPRPQMYRDSFRILDAGWTLNGEHINIPYPPESVLSGLDKYSKYIGPMLHYETLFGLSDGWEDKRILLHFGAVDQLAKVRINGRFVGRHVGGYLPFTFDVTSFIGPEENLLEVTAFDRNSKIIPYGKQSELPDGMWYTSISGIWKTVWLEAVPKDYIRKVKIVPDLSGVSLRLYTSGDIDRFSVKLTGSGYYRDGFTDESSSGSEQVFEGLEGRLQIEDPHLWTPEDPYLYRAIVKAGEDSVLIYFALRTIGLSRVNGLQRIVLNDEPVFLNGVLDQGYFPEGIYVPSALTDYDEEINNMKDLGFNLLRKHLKVEPEYYYCACDRIGMLVMQDMVQSGNYSFFSDTLLPYFQGMRRSDEKKLGLGQDRSNERLRRRIFTKHVRDTVKLLFDHPCVIAWTIFNEGWGQFESDWFYERVKALDPTRLVDSASGWFQRKKSDFDSRHQYFRNRLLSPKFDRPLFISECGGYGYDPEDPLREEEKTKQEERREKLNRILDNAVDKAIAKSPLHDRHRPLEMVETIDLIRKQAAEKYKNRVFQYGGSARSADELTDWIINMYREMVFPALEGGLCGIVYTQVSDVEGEINGLYTYDRSMIKCDPERLRSNADSLYEAYKEALRQK